MRDKETEPRLPGDQSTGRSRAFGEAAGVTCTAASTLAWQSDAGVCALRGKVVNFTNSHAGTARRSAASGNGVHRNGGGWWTPLAHLSQVIVNVGDGSGRGTGGRITAATRERRQARTCTGSCAIRRRPDRFQPITGPGLAHRRGGGGRHDGRAARVAGHRQPPGLHGHGHPHDALVAAGLTSAAAAPATGGLGDMNALRLREKAIGTWPSATRREAAYKVLQ